MKRRTPTWKPTFHSVRIGPDGAVFEIDARSAYPKEPSALARAISKSGDLKPLTVVLAPVVKIRTNSLYGTRNPMPREPEPIRYISGYCDGKLPPTRNASPYSAPRSIAPPRYEHQREQTPVSSLGNPTTDNKGCLAGGSHRFEYDLEANAILCVFCEEESP